MPCDTSIVGCSVVVVDSAEPGVVVVVTTGALAVVVSPGP